MGERLKLKIINADDQTSAPSKPLSKDDLRQLVSFFSILLEIDQDMRKEEACSNQSSK